MRSIPFVSKLEALAFMAAALFVGVGLGAFIGGLPHLSFFQMMIVSISILVSCSISVITAISKANRVWRLRTETLL
jgi:hypothetical protein